jgi:hypothetical protein
MNAWVVVFVVLVIVTVAIAIRLIVLWRRIPWDYLDE